MFVNILAAALRTVSLDVAVTASDDAMNVTCDFSDSEHVCGYTVGNCWNPTTVSYSDTSGNIQ